MINELRKLYFALIKPRSHYLYDSNSTFRHDKRRIVDTTNGEYKGIQYRLETVISEKENPLSVNHVSKLSIEKMIIKNGYDTGANLRSIMEIKSQKQQSFFHQALDQFIKRSNLENIFTRPSYEASKMKTHLILTGLAQDDLEEVRLKEAANFKDNERFYQNALRNPNYTNTQYEIFLLGLAEERFRKIVERQVEKNKENPNVNKPGYEWLLSPEKLMFQLANRGESDLRNDYYLIDGKAFPILEVNDFEHGHEAAQNCIDFALKDGQKILQNQMCLLRHKPQLIERLNVNLTDYILNLPLAKEVYVEIAMENQTNKDLQVAPYFGTVGNEDLETLAKQLIPEILELSSGISLESFEGRHIAVVSFKGYPQEGNRILCYPSRASLKKYNQGKENQIRLVADARSNHQEEISGEFGDLLDDLYKTNRKRWFEHYNVPKEEWDKYR